MALTLHAASGLTTAEIAAAFLVPLPTMAQRITRAKRLLGERGVRFEVPSAQEYAAVPAAGGYRGAAWAVGVVCGDELGGGAGAT